LEHAISSQSEAARTKRPDADSDRVLRAKYLDWCSARIAERFLKLTPDEIYELAQKASSEKSKGSRDAASAFSDALPPADTNPIENFRHIVERVTEVLASNMKLPPYTEWSDAYRKRPSRYDDELLGFWKEAAGK
jgi:hypothetical protein